MSWQNLTLLAVFFLGSFSGIYSTWKSADDKSHANPYSAKLWSQAGDTRSAASRLLDSGRVVDASKLYNKIIETDVHASDLSEFTKAQPEAGKENSAERLTVARDFNNQATALFLAAKSNPDPQLSRKELALASDCLQFAELLSCGNEGIKLPVLYNRSLVLLHQGKEAQAEAVMSQASSLRLKLDPALKKGLLP